MTKSRYSREDSSRRRPRRRRSRSRAFEDGDSDAGSSEETVVVADEDVWFDNYRHPGTKDCRRAIRIVLEDMEQETVKFTKSVYKEILKELRGRRFLVGDKERGNLAECDEDELVDQLREIFESEQSRRLEKIQSRKSLGSESSVREKDSRRKNSRSRSHERRHRRRQSDADESSMDRSRGKQHQHQSRRQISSRNVKRSRDDGEPTSTTGDSLGDPSPSFVIYLDDANPKGPARKMHRLLRHAAVEYDHKSLSDSMYDEFREQMGFETVFFKSPDSDKALKGGKLFRAIRRIYREQSYLLDARPDDVYIECPHFRGTRNWTNAIEQQVERNGGSPFCRETFRALKKDFRKSCFHSGKPPECIEIEREELYEIFHAEYKNQRRRLRKEQGNRQRKSLPRRQVVAVDGEQGPSVISKTKLHQRPIPGNRFCVSMRRRISDRFSRWEWFQIQKDRLFKLPLAIKCREICDPCFKASILPLRNFCRTDKKTRKTCWDKIFQALEVPHLGPRSAWIVLFLLAILVIFFIFFAWFKILHKILLEVLLLPVKRNVTDSTGGSAAAIGE